jgi:hypothetical protein
MTFGPSTPLALDLVPALTIELNIGTMCEIKVLQDAQSAPVLCVRNEDFSLARLGTLRHAVKERVARFSNRLSNPVAAKEPRISIRDSITALYDLHKLGCNILEKLFGESSRRELPRLTQLVRKACTGPARLDAQWAYPRWNADAPPPSLIIVKSSLSSGIPIEILPMLDLDPDKPTGSDDFDELGKLACSFLGFSAIVKRQIGNSLVAAKPIENIPKLPLKLFINRGLRGARKEEFDLRDNAHIDADIGWPDEPIPSQADFPELLAKYLWEADTRFGRGPRDVPDQICHFSCHSNTGVKLRPDDYEIRLKSKQLSGQRTVTLEVLNGALSRLARTNINDERPRPFIFLNSCGSSDLDPAGAGSFPELFLKRGLGFSGFIGTETSIPDDFAAEFSREFYDKLVHGHPIGQSLLLARWNLLTRYKNPLGLMYTLFAEPEIRVRRPVTEYGALVPVQAPTGGLSRLFASLRRMFTFQRRLAN